MNLQNQYLFNERKAAQTAAFFIFKAGGSLEILKLMKLMYLAERESLKQYGESITGDAFVSMPHGPVLSMTLDCINGNAVNVLNGWESWITDRTGRQVSLKDPSMLRDERDLGALSKADLKILQQTWAEYGHFAAWTLRDMTHGQLCPEWTNPNGSSRPIDIVNLFKILGYSEETAIALFENMCEQAEINRIFSQNQGKV
ncbi:Panacea domain-containing protein [Simonsiella muelleri]|uniref:Panacea domain-containing protein n=1 Tax=Simonsiella muelleri TaxID=72 RepID=UPI0028D5BFE4|nr:Panacea domain-containing protein [Simonsiella muelleri]